MPGENALPELVDCLWCTRVETQVEDVGERGKPVLSLRQRLVRSRSDAKTSEDQTADDIDAGRVPSFCHRDPNEA